MAVCGGEGGRIKNHRIRPPSTNSGPFFRPGPQFGHVTFESRWNSIPSSRLTHDLLTLRLI